MSFLNDNEMDEHWEISIEASVIASALAANPDFINAIALAVRNALTKDVRSKGNLFDKWAAPRTPLGVTPQVPGTKRIV